MSGDTLGKRIRDLRLDRQGLEWWIEDCRAEGKEPPEDVFVELRKVSEALLVALDDRDEYV